MKQRRIQLVSLAFLVFISNSCIKKPVSRVLSKDDNDSSKNYETPETFYGSKTPYNPRQKPSSFQSVPEGYKQVYTQVVSRHSSRGLSSPGSDLVLKAMLEKAESEKALTALGTELLADVKLIIKLCALMGYKVEGIEQPGYGNLSALGIKEHQDLGARHYARNKAFYDSIANAVPRRKIEIVSSGKNRAVDSKEFFSQSLAQQNPALKSHIVKSDAVKISSNPSFKGQDGVDRFTLYFHKLNEKDDNVLAETDDYYQVYQDSQKYQAYKKSPELKAIISKIY